MQTCHTSPYGSSGWKRWQALYLKRWLASQKPSSACRAARWLHTPRACTTGSTCSPSMCTLHLTTPPWGRALFSGSARSRSGTRHAHCCSWPRTRVCSSAGMLAGYSLITQPLACYVTHLSCCCLSSTPEQQLTIPLDSHRNPFSGLSSKGTTCGLMQVAWGGMGMIKAHQSLLKAALQDPFNQQFQLLCDYTVPIRAPVFAYTQIIGHSASRLAAQWTTVSACWPAHGGLLNRPGSDRKSTCFTGAVKDSNMVSCLRSWKLFHAALIIPWLKGLMWAWAMTHTCWAGSFARYARPPAQFTPTFLSVSKTEPTCSDVVTGPR